MNVLALALIIYIAFGLGVGCTIAHIVYEINKGKKSAKVLICATIIITVLWPIVMSMPIKIKIEDKDD